MSEFQTDIIVTSYDHNCHIAYRFSQHDIDNGHVSDIIKTIHAQLKEHIEFKEKENAISEGS